MIEKPTVEIQEIAARFAVNYCGECANEDIIDSIATIAFHAIDYYKSKVW